MGYIFFEFIALVLNNLFTQNVHMFAYTTLKLKKLLLNVLNNLFLITIMLIS